MEGRFGGNVECYLVAVSFFVVVGVSEASNIFES